MHDLQEVEEEIRIQLLIAQFVKETIREHSDPEQENTLHLLH